MATVVTVRDRGWDKILKSIRKAGQKRDPHVAVGLRGNGPASKQAKGSPKTLVEIGTFHEFGIPPMPMRSFLRAGIDANAKELNRLIDRLAGRVVIGKLSGAKALDTVGIKATAKVKTFMAKGISPDKKDGDKARLIDTGQLRGSIDHEVRLK